MNAEDLADLFDAIIRKHWRSLIDSEGRPTQQLLDELVAAAAPPAPKPAPRRKAAT